MHDRQNIDVQGPWTHTQVILGLDSTPKASNIWQLTWAQAHLEAQRYCVRANRTLKNIPKGQETLLRSDLGPLGLQCEARKSASVPALATQM